MDWGIATDRREWCSRREMQGPGRMAVANKQRVGG